MAQLKIVIANRVVEGHDLSERTVLGRSRSASIVLADPSVSREHAVITAEGPRYFIEDLGSTAGVHINGRRVERERLQEGDVVTLGDLMCIFTLETLPPEADHTVDCHAPADLDAGAPWATARDLQVSIPSSREMVDALGAFVTMLLDASPLEPQERLRFSMAAQEAFGNAYRHGNQKDAARRLTWRLIRDEHRVSLRVRDEGDGFDFRAALTTARDSDPLEVARARYQSGQPGGLGIMMMVRGSDMVEFSRRGAEVCLTKCPADVFATKTVYGNLAFDDLGTSPEEIAEARKSLGTGPDS